MARRRAVTTNARSMAYARSQGWLAGVVERRLPKTFTTKDLFGVFDLVVLRGGDAPTVVGVQTTSADHHSERVAKVLAWPELDLWLAAGAQAEVWSWRKAGARGTRKLWQVRVEAVAPAPAASLP